MDENKDRRSFDRIEIPGMNAVLVNNYWYYLFSFKLLYSFVEIIFKKTPLKNISVTGACLVSKQNFEPGDSIHMILSVPGMRKIPVTGSIRWSSFSTDQNTYYAGVQFMAFNKGKRYDSYQRLKQINELVAEPAVASEKH
jgi:hypothetical protein